MAPSRHRVVRLVRRWREPLIAGVDRRRADAEGPEQICARAKRICVGVPQTMGRGAERKGTTVVASGKRFPCILSLRTHPEGLQI